MYESYAYWKLATEQLTLALVVDVVIVFILSGPLRGGSNRLATFSGARLLRRGPRLREHLSVCY